MKTSEIVSLPNKWSLTMKKYGISARMVAKTAGVNLPHFYNVLRGRSSPTLEYVQKVDVVLTQIIDERENINLDG
tara:strand:- start:66 stop:290 length:225 start_codon:yes stop_codon:yes gene_type:complete